MKKPKTLFGFPVHVVDDLPKNQIMLVDPQGLAPEIHQLLMAKGS